MKCPFELPVKAEKFQNTRPPLYRIVKLLFPYTKDEADYIVQAINSHEKLVEAILHCVDTAGAEDNKYVMACRIMDLAGKVKKEQALKEAEKQ